MKAEMDELSLRSLVLAQEFDRYVLEHPRFAQKIPRGAEVVLLPAYDLELREYNFRNAGLNREPKRPLIYVEIDRLRPRRSQIVRPRMKIAAPPSKNGKKQALKRTASTHA